MNSHPFIFSLFSVIILTTGAAAETRDLIIVAGQSNSVGFDAVPSELPAADVDREVMFWFRTGDPPPDQYDTTSAGEWTTLKPQPKGRPFTPPADSTEKPPARQYGNFRSADGGFGPEIGVARELLSRQDQPLAIVKAAFSGTGLRMDWNPEDPGDGGSCYRALIQETQSAIAAAKEKQIELHPRALVWVQGESDCNLKDSLTYEQNMNRMLAALRKDLKAPRLTALLGFNTRFGNGNNPHIGTVVAAQKAVADSDPFCSYVDTSGAETLPPSHTHFTAAGTLDIGRRYATALLQSEAAPAASKPAARPADAPNIVLMMGDDHGWDETGYNGHPYLKTPVMDEMATTGLRLNRFFSGAPNCSPTRGSFLTGRHPNRYGTFNPGYSTRPEEISVAHLMHQAGYVCGHFGKWHLGPVKASSPTNPGRLGFDTWLSHDNFFELNPFLSRDGGDPVEFKGESSEILVREASQFIDKATADGKPFFVVIWFGSPHEPYSGLESDLALYDNLPTDFANRQVSLTSNETGEQTRRLQRDVLRERYAEITAMDRAIGQLRTHLTERGQRNNTLLWYCGDNGTSGDAAATVPFRGVKSTIYDGGLRVPGLIEWPARITKGRQSDLNSVTSDILPTLCDLTGQSLPDRPLDGISLKGLLDGEMTDREKPIAFWQWTARPHEHTSPYFDQEAQTGTTPLVKLMNGKATRDFQNFRYEQTNADDYAGPRALLDGRFKLVVDGSKKLPLELFDVIADPTESHNIAAQNSDVVQRMQQQLQEWQTSVLHSLTGADYN